MSLIQFALALPALAAVLAIALAAAWFARKLGLNRAVPRGTHIILLDNLPIDAKRRLHLIECNGRRLLLATGGGGDILLSTWSIPAEPRA